LTVLKGKSTLIGVRLTIQAILNFLRIKVGKARAVLQLVERPIASQARYDQGRAMLTDLSGVADAAADTSLCLNFLDFLIS
jgi:hypothetical protein